MKKLIMLFVWATLSCVLAHYVPPNWVWSIGWSAGLLAGAAYVCAVEWEYEQRKAQQASDAGEPK